MLLIDYEYSSYVNRGFDLANHFCEWAADYHSAKPHILHFDRLPSIEEQRVFLEAYLDAKESHIAVNSSLTRHRSRSSSSSASHLLLTSPPLEPQQQQQDKPLFTINNNKQLLLISPMLSPSLSPLLTPDAVSGLRQMELKSLFEEVNHFIPCSHVIWALWGLIQAGQSVIDFDYFEYSLQRFSEFFKWRSKLNWTTLT